MHEMPEPKEHAADRAPRPAADAFLVCLLAPPTRGQDTAVLSVRGELDLLTAPVLREALLPVLERGTSPVVVDLSEVPFMDSSGVHALLHTRERLGSQNRRLAIACREHGQVHRLLALVGLLDAFSVYRSRNGAAGGDADRLLPQPVEPRSRPLRGTTAAAVPIFASRRGHPAASPTRG